MVKEFIENELKKIGCTDIHWYYGREGYYVLAKRLNSTMCYNINQIITDKLTVENLTEKFIEQEN
jgi:hypothetical protein